MSGYGNIIFILKCIEEVGLNNAWIVNVVFFFYNLIVGWEKLLRELL